MSLDRSLATAALQAAALLAVAPLLRGGINKMKAAFQSRQGPPLLQGYYDLAKLLRKEPALTQALLSTLAARLRAAERSRAG